MEHTCISPHKEAKQRQGQSLDEAIVARRPLSGHSIESPFHSIYRPSEGSPLSTVTGRARDARAGAIVLYVGSENSMPICVDGLESWGNQEGRAVSASGILRQRAVVPIATIGEDGSISHGLDDVVFVIDDPGWKIEVQKLLGLTHAM
jgi:hypothetical protein